MSKTEIAKLFQNGRQPSGTSARANFSSRVDRVRIRRGRAGSAS